uniref:AbrB/MazE/SpoVT family DNA-binding domain-containing protein n=1 Tax=candidate division WOR-3 bacterium TaxID=2052148 RepID=A0A7V3NUE5_UNCW3
MRSRKVITTATGGVGLRRIMRIRRGAAVSLPQEFLERHGLAPGDEVAIFFNGEFVVRPLGHPDRMEPLEEK